VNIMHFDTLPSTSTFAKENASTLHLPALIVADFQTAGRGRQGKSFYSPKGTGLYFTLLFEADEKATLLTPAAAVAVCKAIGEMTSKKACIKWVNDIFLDGKKICGILTECFTSNGKKLFSTGIGINLTTEDFPQELTQAGSLNAECNKEELSKKISEYILEYAENPDNTAILSEYEKRLFVIGKEVTFNKNNLEFTATVKGINNQCNLIVTTPDGKEEILSSGEISIKI